jgi:hypothetical protein
MAIIRRFSFSSFRFVIRFLVCYLNLLHIHRENSRKSKVSDFSLIGNLIPNGNFMRNCVRNEPSDRLLIVSFSGKTISEQGIVHFGNGECH